jgi:hypothetical protein
VPETLVPASGSLIDAMELEQPRPVIKAQTNAPPLAKKFRCIEGFTLSMSLPKATIVP